jgi:hypothetical protein
MSDCEVTLVETELPQIKTKSKVKVRKAKSPPKPVTFIDIYNENLNKPGTVLVTLAKSRPSRADTEITMPRKSSICQSSITERTFSSTATQWPYSVSKVRSSRI